MEQARRPRDFRHVSGRHGRQFNEGVQKLIKERPYSIGYLEVTYAVNGHVQAGLVRNASGNFVAGDSAGITAAAAAAQKKCRTTFVFRSPMREPRTPIQ